MAKTLKPYFAIPQGIPQVVKKGSPRSHRQSLFTSNRSNYQCLSYCNPTHYCRIFSYRISTALVSVESMRLECNFRNGTVIQRSKKTLIFLPSNLILNRDHPSSTISFRKENEEKTTKKRIARTRDALS